MQEERRNWYRRGLGPRIDALELARRGVMEKKPEALPGIRRLAHTLNASSQLYEFPEITAAAKAVEAATGNEAVALVGELIRVLRTEIIGHPAHVASVLIIGGEPAASLEISRQLAARGKTAVIVGTAHEAEQVLVSQEIVFIVLDVFLPDADGRQFIATLRSRPMTAAIPVVVMAAKISDNDTDQKLVQKADGYFQKPVDAEQVAEFVSMRMKRAHETLRAARRDLLTGLLNRAAFCEHNEHMLHRAGALKEPAALVLLKIDRIKEIEAEHGAALRDMVLRHVAALLSTSFRAMDVICRWGVSEFAVLFPGEDQFGGTRAVEKIMATLQRHKFAAPDGDPIPLTLSAGVTVVTDKTLCEEAMERAAHNLYLAESSGGNHIVTSETEKARRKDHILIISRDPVMPGVVKGLIEKNNFRVAVMSATAQNAKDVLSSRRFHLVIIDEDLENGGGFRLLKGMRAIPNYNRTPVIMLISTEDHMVQALEFGASDYMVKPFKPLDLLACIRRVLSRGILNSGALTTVLVVDSDLPDLLMAGTALQKAGGFKVMMDRDGRNALRRLLELHPQIVIWNWAMPELGGADLIKALANSSGYEKTAIIFLADPKDAEQVKKINDRRIKGIIPRPVEVLRLAANVWKMLNLIAPEVATPAGQEKHWQHEIQNLFQS